MKNSVKNSILHHFADDTNLLCSETGENRLKKKTNEDLKPIYIWLCANRLSLNVDKTEFIVFRLSRIKITNRFTLKALGEWLFSNFLCFPMVYNMPGVIFDGFQDIETEVKLRTLGENLKKTIASKEKIDVNLNARHQAGLRCLEKRVKNQEIVVFQTDKSGRFSVDTRTNYLLAGEVHTANDETITRKKCLEIEDEMNAHLNA